jgi:excisionase family DNA binding protein
MDEKFEEMLARPTLSVDDAAEVLGVSRNGLYALAKQGKIRSIRLGGRVLIPTIALREMIGAAA